MACLHATSADIRPPRPSESVYREDCTLCFDSIDDPSGLDVCLHCFNGGCASERIHGRLHAQQAQHPLAVNIKRTRKKTKRPDGEPPEKMSKLAINAETDQDRYDVQTDVHCFECGVSGLIQDGKVGEAVNGIMKANTYAQQEEVKAWELEMVPCEHTLCLQQEASHNIPSGNLGQCAECELKENLWLCLSCGNLGCGRQQAGGMPGNSHAKGHGAATSHPVAVKLGSLTADGNADVFCYSCDEERVDPEIVVHLANWGIDITGRVKTEKSVTEMNIEQNLTWDFSMVTGDGKEMQAMFGPGFTGLKNLGNSCYLNSVLQSIFSMPEFADRYYRPDESPLPVSNPAEDLEIQLRKIADGLLSGRYSKPDADMVMTSDSVEQPHQKGLAPAMLKHLIGRGHAEFSTMRQQDSFELLLHLLKLISRSQQTSRGRYKDVTDPVEAFRYVLEQKLQCLKCKKVRYREDEMENLSVAVPIRRRPRLDNSTMADGEKEAKKEEFEPVTLKECLEEFTAPEIVELTCSSCGGKGFTKQSLFKTFPRILAINARRFELVGWVPTKQDVPLIVSDEDNFNMEVFRSKGKQPDEEELPEDHEGLGEGSNAFVPNVTSLEMLMSMGFPRVRCERALHATGNSDVEVAAGWLFEHMEDPDIDQPLDLGSNEASSGASSASLYPEKIANLAAMGFSAPQAHQALKETGGDLERAVDWLFSHPDATGDFGEKVDASVDATAAALKIERDDKKPAYFALKSIICHKGSSIHAGHYVAFIKKKLPSHDKEGWVLFNDERVALGADAEEMKKYAYIYFFHRNNV